MEEDYSHALDSPGSSVTLVGHSSGWRVQGASSKQLTKVLLARSIAPVLCVRDTTEGAEASYGIMRKSGEVATIPADRRARAETGIGVGPGVCRLPRMHLLQRFAMMLNQRAL
jgi:hypothetical protein